MKIIKKIGNNVWYILKNGCQLALTFLSIAGTYFTLLNPDRTEIGIFERIIVLILCVVVAYIVYFIWILVCKKVTVYEQDEKKISIQYGDFIEIIEKYKSLQKMLFL